jgi:hypothetical protein
MRPAPIVLLAGLLASSACYIESGPSEGGSWSRRIPSAPASPTPSPGCAARWDSELGRALPVVLSDTTQGRRFASPAPTCGVPESGPTASYRWEAPVAGIYAFSVSSDAFDSLLDVREGPCSGNELACLDHASDGRSVELELKAGDTCVIEVRGHGEAWGRFQLRVELTATVGPGEPDGPICGDRLCSVGESCASCPEDCGDCPESCGDGYCGAGEDCANCPEDCGDCQASCGDGYCDAGEDCGNCPGDCGDCPASCGDGACNATETCASCPEDCGDCAAYCGDGACSGGEDCGSCEEDCGACPAACGDGQCDSGEDCDSCPADCGDCD